MKRKKSFIEILFAFIFAVSLFSSEVYAQNTTESALNTIHPAPTNSTIADHSLTPNYPEEQENIATKDTPVSNDELTASYSLENHLVQNVFNNFNLQEDSFSLKAEIDNKIINPFVDPETQEIYLYLPSQIDTANIQLAYTGDISSISSGTLDATKKKITFDANHSNYIDITFADNTTKRVNIVVSNLPCVQIDLKDGLSLDTVKDNPKDIKYQDNTVSISDPTGENALAPTGGVELKGRGNNTWGNPLKKPYQIKFEKKTSVLGMTKAKKWVLLANMNDATLMRNNIVFDMAKDSGELAPDSRFVDLFINGNYEGN